MIFTDRTITIRNSKSAINEPVILYRGDFEVSIRFTIMESKFRFKSGVNLVDSEKASFGQLAILSPYGGNVFSEVVKCEDGTVTFTLTKEMIDQLEEIGLYSFQIRLFDYYRESRVSIPPVEFGIEVREPVASEDHDNEVNNAIVGYSIAKVVDGLNEDVGDTFDDNGQYNKTDWKTGDRISQGKLNKIEDALDKINQNEKNDVAALDKRVTNNFNVLHANKANKNEVFSMINMGQDVKEAMTGGSVAVVGENTILRENIVDNEITFKKLSNELKNNFEVDCREVIVQFSKNGYWDYVHGTKIDYTGDLSYSEEITVREGDEFIISGCSDYRANLYLIKDSSGNVLDVFPNTNAAKVFYSDVKFEIPKGGSILCLNSHPTNPTELNILNDIKVNGNNIKFKKNTIEKDMLDIKVSSLFKDVYNTEINLNWYNGGFYRFKNLEEKEDVNFSRAIRDVVEGEKYEITGTSCWEANLYYIVNENNEIISTFPNTNQTSTQYKNIRFIIPAGGKYLYINQLNTNLPTTLKTLSGYEVVSNQINKKWVAFGDSLTDAGTLNGGFNYTNYVSIKLGLDLVNCGKGGTGYINNNGGAQQFYNRTYQIPADTDILTVFGSFNDLYMSDIPIGVITDQDPTTLYGAINKFLNNCWAINPDIVIGIISPTPWSGWWRGHPDNLRVEQCVNYVNILKTVAEYYSLPFLDLFSCSNLRPWDNAFNAKYYLNADGTHPNSEGHKIISPKIEAFIKSIIQNYN